MSVLRSVVKLREKGRSVSSSDPCSCGLLASNQPPGKKVLVNEVLRVGNVGPIEEVRAFAVLIQPERGNPNDYVGITIKEWTTGFFAGVCEREDQPLTFRDPPPPLDSRMVLSLHCVR